MSFGQMRENWSFLASHISSMFRDAKMKHTKKRTLYLLSNMEEARLCSGAALLHLAQGVLNVCRVQWNLKTIKAFWSKMCCPVSERLVSVTGHGSSNRIMTQNTQLKRPRMAKRKTLAHSEVAFYEPWSKSYWTSVEGAETCSLEKAPFKPETAGAVCSQGVGQNTRWQVQKSHWELQKSIDCSDCLKRLCNKILS